MDGSVTHIYITYIHIYILYSIYVYYSNSKLSSAIDKTQQYDFKKWEFIERKDGRWEVRTLVVREVKEALRGSERESSSAAIKHL